MAQQTIETTDNLNEGRVKINENFTENYLKETVLAIHADAGSQLTLTNQANTEQNLGNAGYTTRVMDAGHLTHIRVSCQVGTSSASANTPRLYPQYSLDNVTYVTIGSGSGSDIISLASTGHKRTDWIALPVEAQADGVYFRIAQNGGDGAADPNIGYANLSFK